LVVKPETLWIWEVKLFLTSVIAFLIRIGGQKVPFSMQHFLIIFRLILTQCLNLTLLTYVSSYWKYSSLGNQLIKQELETVSVYFKCMS